MKLANLTDSELVAQSKEIKKILAARKKGVKREKTDKELLNIFKKHHSKFLAAHKNAGGLTSRSKEAVDYYNVDNEDDFVVPIGYILNNNTCRRNFGKSMAPKGEHPYYSVTSSVESGRSNIKFTLYGIKCTFDWEEVQYNDDGWESYGSEKVEYILTRNRKVDGLETGYKLADFKLVRRLAKKLGLA